MYLTLHRNKGTPTHLYLTATSIHCTHPVSQPRAAVVQHNKQRLSLSLSLYLSVCHCLPASPWVIASHDTRLLVPQTHPNAQEIKCSTEVIKRVNPACIFCPWPGHCGGMYYHIKPRQRGSAQHSLITPHLVGIYSFSKNSMPTAVVFACGWEGCARQFDLKLSIISIFSCTR